MKQEDWDFISSNWGSPVEEVMEKIGLMKEADKQEKDGLNAKIENQKEEIEKLNSQNRNLSNTNINLVMRLTDPSLAHGDEEPEKEKPAPKIDDYDKFVIRK